MRRAHEDGGSLPYANLLWLALVGGVIYFGLMYLPLYVEQYEVKQLLQEIANTAWKEPDDEKLRLAVLEKAKNVGSHYEIRNGQELNIPGIVLLAEDVFVNRDTQAQTIVIQARYTKHVNYPFLKRQKAMTFSPSAKAELGTVKW
jgi:hypothetical protein